VYKFPDLWDAPVVCVFYLSLLLYSEYIDVATGVCVCVCVCILTMIR
jgi:hypothetical protein